MSAPIVIGTVLFDGFELLDVYGPLEMFGLLEDKARLVMLAENPGPVRSFQGPQSFADNAMKDAQDLDVVLVPGGFGTRREMKNPAFLQTLAAVSARSRYTASVCTGSLLLAHAGLLDGRKATSNKRVFNFVKASRPAVHWIPEARWVEDGPVFTASGVSAGMDMALALIAKLFDRQAALDVAARAEYEWHEDSHWDPFAKLNGLI
ncbi:DJ-1/PfpI family protein [Opitutaceae bacterium EW11]|nr:DJ-1/PfpI family protein [Opitutaceae bacterium EW11]